MHKGVLLSGGCPGYPHAAATGAASAGGLTVAVSPAANRSEHSTLYNYPLDSDITVYTGMGRKGRNVILVRSADAGIFIGGGMGTLNEFTIAFEEWGSSGAIGILAETGGISDRLTDLISVVGKSPRGTPGCRLESGTSGPEDLQTHKRLLSTAAALSCGVIIRRKTDETPGNDSRIRQIKSKFLMFQGSGLD